jgi:TIR domain/Domain of unknown function (DUF4384)
MDTHLQNPFPGVEVFISFASQDLPRVLEVVRSLAEVGVRAWVDRQKILGGQNYGPEIVYGIRNCKVLALMCSDASLRSKNVKQEIQLAWKYERPYLPLLLEPTNFPDQLQYWLEGWQWIEVLDRPVTAWLPEVLAALAKVDVQSTRLSGGAVHSSMSSISDQARPIVQPTTLPQGLQGLRALAKFTDQLWPVPTEQVRRGATPTTTRGLGAPQDSVQYGYCLGSRISLALELDRAGHLMLLDEGPEGLIYCLCPSWFSPETSVPAHRVYLPQERSHYDAFVVTGRPGREHLLAIITDEPLGLDWLPHSPTIPARVLNQADIDTVLTRLHALGGDRWFALSTYFDVIA